MKNLFVAAFTTLALTSGAYAADLPPTPPETTLPIQMKIPGARDMKMVCRPTEYFMTFFKKSGMIPIITGTGTSVTPNGDESMVIYYAVREPSEGFMGLYKTADKGKSLCAIAIISDPFLNFGNMIYDGSGNGTPDTEQQKHGAHPWSRWKAFDLTPEKKRASN